MKSFAFIMFVIFCQKAWSDIALPEAERIKAEKKYAEVKCRDAKNLIECRYSFRDKADDQASCGYFRAREREYLEMASLGGGSFGTAKFCHLEGADRVCKDSANLVVCANSNDGPEDKSACAYYKKRGSEYAYKGLRGGNDVGRVNYCHLVGQDKQEPKPQ